MNSDLQPIVLPLNRHSQELAMRIGQCLEAEQIGDADDFSPQLTAAFCVGQPIVAICATGIVIRLLAGELKHKSMDAPVVVVAADGSAVVPLLGGHHGANQLARDIAKCLGVEAAITTASDLVFGVDLENPPAGWVLANPEHIKSFVSALLAGSSVRLDEAINWFSGSHLPINEDGELAIIAGKDPTEGNENTLVYLPQSLAIGIGCERGVDAEEVLQLLLYNLQNGRLDPRRISGVFSLDLKCDEPAIHEVSEHLGVPARFFDVETLRQESNRLANPSDVILAEVGVAGVAEAAALAAVGDKGQLIIEKRKSRRATCAVAESPIPLIVETLGQPRGELYVVGIGPGDANWRTSEAEQLIRSAEIVIGYQLYLDLVSDLVAGKTLRPYALGEEEKRVRDAITLAAGGKRVALISSGDAGIFAMGALVQEILAQSNCPASWNRVKLINVPGVSAMQAAAARIGAPLGHDFCAISLSDLLTPREVIVQRIDAAAAGDFIIAFYNPVSERRRDLLNLAKDKLLQYRDPDTPVVVARNLGRAEEDIKIIALVDLDADLVDMLCVVLIGSSQTKTRISPSGKFVFTPRGYKLNQQDAAQ